MLRMRQAAEYLGVSTITLREYCNNGEVIFFRTPKGQRVFKQEDLDKFIGKTEPQTPENTGYYLRASDGNKNTLNNQKRELEQAYGPAKHIYKDSASGLNEKRPGLKRLIKDAEQGKIKYVYATYPDRISRFGASYIQHILKQAGCQIEYLHEKDQTPQEELMQDFMSLIASFSGRFYQMRSYENQHKLLDEAKNTLTLKEQTKDHHGEKK